jgi:hypothetical protein
MSEYMTMAEIETEYPDEGVFLAKPTTNRYSDVTGGHVIFHHPDRAEYSRLMEDYPEMPDVRHFASRYTASRRTRRTSFQPSRT